MGQNAKLSRRIACRSGIDRDLRENVRTLESKREAALAAAREIASAKYDLRTAAGNLIGARIALLACDIALDGLSTATGPVGLLIGVLYSQGQKLVDAYHGKMDLQKALEASTGAKLAAIKKHLGPT